MSVNSVPNKYEMFQLYYYDKNNKWLSITDAMQYYYDLDNETRADFEKFYKDETGYEIISPNGYGLDRKVNSSTTDKDAKDDDHNPTAKVIRTKKVKTKKVNRTTVNGKVVKTPEKKDGKVVWTTKDVPVYESTLSTLNKANIGIKATMEAIAKRRGVILDPVWSAYSAEEIMAMYNDGVNIPQDIVDLASTELQENPTANPDDEEGIDAVDETSEKEPFLNLIPIAKEKIEKCEENNDKLEKEISDLVPEQQKQEKDAADNFKKQRETLDEYQNSVKEYTKLQKKIENGETLTEKEQKRYEDLSKVLGAQKDEADSFELDKAEITKSLNDINILAVLGEKLAEETIEVGDELKDYTSKTNYKATKKSLIPQLGAAAMWGLADYYMDMGKAVGKDAVDIGNDTKEYTTQTQGSVDGIADTLDIKDGLASKEAILNGEVQPSEDNQEEKAEKDENQDKEQKMPLVVTDKFVLDLIKEGRGINADLAKQIKIAVSQTKNAKGDIVFAGLSDKRVTQIVKAFYDAETKRQQEIEKTEQENEKKQQEIQDVMDEAQKRAEEEAKEKAQAGNLDPNANVDAILSGKNDKNDNVQVELNDEEKKKIDTLNDDIAKNNNKIEGVKQESVQHREEVKKSTSKEKTKIDKSMPIEKDAQKVNQTYQEKDLPEHDERMDFINKAGMILAGIGTGEITIGSRFIFVGHGLLSNPWTMSAGIQMIAFGSAVLTKGTISLAIGLTAMKVSDDESLIENAEKKTDIAEVNINKSISDLSTVDKKIIDVTKAMSAGGEDDSADTPSATNGPDSANNNDNAEGADGSQDSQNGENGAPNGVTAQTGTNTAPAVATTTSNTSAAKTTTQDPATDAATETPSEVVDNNTQNPAEEVKQDEKPQGTEDAETPAGEEPVDTNTTSNDSSKTEKEEDPQKAAKDEEKNASKQKSQLKKQTDKQNSEVKDANREAKDYTKESKKLSKDEKKSQKQLEKESKAIEKEIKKQEAETIKLTQESQEKAKKQQEMLAEYETLSAQNETLAAEDANKKASSSNQQNQQQAAGSTGFAMMTTGGAQGGNADKINQNNERITFLSTEFKVSSNVINRNKVKITKFQSSIKTKTKKFQKKTKLVTKKAKAAEKKEKQKQKKLKVQLGAVGIAENVFSITTATGTVLTTVGSNLTTTGTALIAIGTSMLSNPFTAAAGAAIVSTGTAIDTSGTSCTSVGTVLNTIGLYGTLACGVTKAAINIANGNLAAGLMALGQTAISAAMSMTGAGAAGNSALTFVSQGLSVVSSSADMVNNVRAVQGKEASGFASKLSAVAGVGSAVTGVAGSFGNFAQSGTLSKVAKIGTAVGTALSSTSQMMSTFGGESKAANILGMVGGAINTVSSVASMVGAKQDQKNPEVQEKQNAKNEKTKAKAMAKAATKADKLNVQATGMTVEQANQANINLKNNMNNMQAKMQTQIDAQMAQLRADFNSKTPAMQQDVSNLPNISGQDDTLASLPTNSTEFDVSKMGKLEGLGIQKTDMALSTKIKGLDTPIAPLNLENNDSGKKSSLVDKISQGIGAASTVAGAILQNGQNSGNQQQQKKQAPAANLDKRTKDIMKKNKKQRANTKKMLEDQRKIAALKKLRAAV